MVNRLIFITAIIGILVCFQLWFVEKLEYERGCLGFSAASKNTEELSCKVVASSEESRTFGIPNFILGFFFYFFIAIISFLKVFSSKPFLLLLQKVSLAVVVVGFLLSLYFTYCQLFKICAICPLCLTSACLVLILLVLHLIALFKREKELSPEERIKELRFFIIVLLTASVIILAELLTS